MTDLVGAKAIADELGRLAGFTVSEWQVYRLAAQRSPINRDRERWTVQASASELREWWSSSRLAARFAKRLKQQALGRQGAHVARRKHIEIRAQAKGELRIVGIVGVDDLATNPFLDAVKNLGDVDTIRVLVNSDGGLVSDGLAIYHALRQHKARIEVEIIGVAASMASAIAMAGDKVSIAEDGLFMLHDPWTSAAGNADDLRSAADMLDKHGESLAGIYARKTKFTEDEILEMMGRNGGDGTWLNAEEALDMGFVDSILQPAEARLPNSIPAAALAKRVTRKGVKSMNGFAKKLAALIAAKVKGDTSKEDVIDELAVEAEMTVEDVEKVIEGKAYPTLAQLRAFADVLGATTKDLRALAEGEGHKFEAKKPKQSDSPANRGAQPVQNQIDVGAAVREALAAERQRQSAIRSEATRFGLPENIVQEIVDQAPDVAEARHRILNYLATNQPRIQLPHGRVAIDADERDKWLQGMEQWLMIKSGQARLIEAHAKKTTDKVLRLDPGQFRGYRLLDIAREALEREGVNCRGKSPREIAKLATIRAESGLGTRSDFPVLLENVLHKMLLAAYETASDQWRMVAATGSVQDFRAHPRLRLGSLPALSNLLETGEFRQMHFPDADKETIQASTKGNIIGLSRQAIVNDDVDGFSRLVTMLGRAADRSIEIDVFALIASNSGLGPTMNDGNALFNAAHNNIDTNAAAPSVDSIEAGRVLMAQQKDRDGNDFLNLRPAVWVGPIGLGAKVRTAINAEFDFDAETSGSTGKFMKPNVVRDLLSAIVDTPRLTGTRWYLLADPAIAPVFEVVFLEGQESPVIETVEGFDYDGIRWRVRHDYGVGATDFVGATTNAGA